MSWKRRIASAAVLVTAMVCLPLRPPVAQQSKSGEQQPVLRSRSNDADWQAEGEKRFRANCGRCHQSPHKFPPRMVMTIERHMRVRATLTDEDMRLIVRYLTQ